MNGALIKYAQRSAKKHAKEGTAPKAKLPHTSYIDLTEPDVRPLEDSQFNMDALNAHKMRPAHKKKQVSWQADEKLDTQRLVHNLGPKAENRRESAEAHYDGRAAAYADIDVDRTISKKTKLKNLTIRGKTDPSEGTLLAQPSIDDILVGDSGDEFSLDGVLEWHFESASHFDGTALKNVSGSLKNGQVCVLVGDRDSRKDTFMRLLSGRALDMQA